MSAKQRGLGRGLGALIGDFQEEPESGAVTKLPLQKVEPNPDQPRRTFDEEELQALRVNDLFALLGQRTRMLRTQDISLHDTEAATIAARKASDIRARVRLTEETPKAVLLSIHQNHFPESKYRGAQVFYAAADGSRALAERLQTALGTQLDPDNHRSCKKAGEIYLLKHVSCPAVLVECGFLSNPAEEALLRTPEYQKKLAAVLCCGMLEFLEEPYESC